MTKHFVTLEMVNYEVLLIIHIGCRKFWSTNPNTAQKVPGRKTVYLPVGTYYIVLILLIILLRLTGLSDLNLPTLKSIDLHTNGLETGTY